MDGYPRRDTVRFGCGVADVLATISITFTVAK